MKTKRTKVVPKKSAKTHPWIRFQLDASRASYSLWMGLGEIRSKCEHVSNTLLPPEVAGALEVLYLAKGVSATTAIEGNTLSEDEVLERIVRKKRLPKSKEYEGKEIDNIVDACRQIVDELLRVADCRLTVDRIRRFNKLVLRSLPRNEDVKPGELRHHSVVVGNYRGAPAEDCEYLLERMCMWLNDEMPAPSDDQRIAFGVLRAIMAHLYLAWIHPFGDGNGRTARLIEFQLLLAAGVPSISAHLLSNHYNQTRGEYYRQLDLASKSGGNVLPFVEYAVQGLVDGLSDQIEHIRRHQYWVNWKDFVYDRFKGLTSKAAHRQRLLALELGRNEGSVLVASIRRMTPDLAVEYAGRTPRSVNRDVDELIHIGLARRVGARHVEAQREQLQQFLPARLEVDRRLR